MRANPIPLRRSPILLEVVGRVLLAFVSAVAGILATFSLFLLASRAVYAGRALPGVSAAGVNLTGMTRQEIEAALAEVLTYPETGRVLLRDGDRLWSARPVDLGVMIDKSAMARQALAVGRQGGFRQRIREQLEAWYQGQAITAVVVHDMQLGASYLETLATQIDMPVVEASISVNGLDVTTLPGQIGRRLDIPQSLAALTPVAGQMHDADLQLVIEETAPGVLDASPYAEMARRVLSQPLAFTAEGAGPWQIQPTDLAPMLRFDLVRDEDGTSSYRVRLDADQLAAFLGPLAPEVERKPANARFYFDDETRELVLIQPAVIGRTLDVSGSIDHTNTRLAAGDHEIPLVFQTQDPPVKDDATAAQLGIAGLVSREVTYFAGSSTARIQNIKMASGAFHGLLVAPGETLSMAEVLGDISLDKGYTEALIIFGDRTIKGLGGGVCQVSTTLFRTVFFGGYPIVERYPHAYRVSYYERGPDPAKTGPGLDATVFAPLVDFRFTNDTPYWLLMETYVYKDRLEWKFYSTSDGRIVQWTRSQSEEIDPPKPLYIENPELDEGEIKQVDWAAKGMDVVVNRTVLRDGQILSEDIIKTHYLPWRAVYEFGPGTELPDDVEIQEKHE